MNIPHTTLTKKPTYIKLVDGVDFYQLFEKIEAAADTCFILESLGDEGRRSRYSVIGFNPLHQIHARGQVLYINKKAYHPDNPYFALRELMPEQTIARKYAGGLVGYLGYDTVNYVEPAIQVKQHSEFDQLMFGYYADGLILDKTTGELLYFHYGDDRSDFVQDLLAASPPRNTDFRARHLRDTATRNEHARTVNKVKEDIQNGRIFQCEVGFKSEYRITGNALGIYKRLRQVNPSPYMYFLKFGDKKIIGASPESLFVLRDGEMSTSPLAGTVRRGRNESEDLKLARQLLNDPKEIAEHNMLVDLHRNDIGRVAQFGSVRTPSLMDIKKFSHVQHISSEITGHIRPEEDMFSGLAANFPAGTLSGAPKIEAMKIIDANELEARGPYGGAVGHFGFNGDCTFAIAIRSLYVNGEHAYAQTSGGIVYDSKPDKEFDEIRHKLAAMKKVLS